MDWKKFFAAFAANLVLIVGGVYYDIRYLTIGGIVQAADGYKANPMDKSELGWGIFKVLMSGAGVAVAVVAGVAVTAVIYGKSIWQAVNRWRTSRRRNKGARV